MKKITETSLILTWFAVMVVFLRMSWHNVNSSLFRSANIYFILLASIFLCASYGLFLAAFTKIGKTDAYKGAMFVCMILTFVSQFVWYIQAGSPEQAAEMNKGQIFATLILMSIFILFGTVVIRKSHSIPKDP